MREMGSIKNYAPSVPFSPVSHPPTHLTASSLSFQQTLERGFCFLFSQSSLQIKANRMHQTLPFKSRSLHSTEVPFLVSPSISYIKENPSCNISATWLPLRPAKCRLFYGSSRFLISNLHSKYLFQDFHRRALVISARKSRRRSGSWVPSGKAALGLALFIASNLRILPDPIDLILKEYGFGGEGGDGGGLGSGNGFGWGGFEGWGKRRKGKFIKLGFFLGLLFFVVTLFVSRKDFDGSFGDYLGFGILGLVLLGFLDNNWQLGGFRGGLVLGFCCCGFMVILGLKKDELQRWVVHVIRDCFPVKNFLGKRRRKFLWLR